MLRRLLPTALLIALLAASTGCFEHPSQPVVRKSASTCAPATGFGGANERNLPAAFPKDFPVYPGAQFVAGTHTAQMVAATWMSSAAKSSIRDHYEKQLQSGDWQLFGVQYTDPCKAYWHVERRSDTHYGGQLTVDTGLTSGGSSFISADLGKK